MGHAYIPGLKVARSVVVRKKRVLPIAGQVLVEPGQRVGSGTVVARTELPGKVHVLNVVNRLGISPDEIRAYMLKKEGDGVARDEPVAETRPWIKFLRSECRSPVQGILESVSQVTGQVLVREPPLPLELSAYIDGTVVETLPREGAVVETRGMFVQGIFGVGGERTGPIAIACASPEEDLTAERLVPSHAGQVVVGGALVTPGALARAAELGVAALVAGGIHDRDLVDLLGYDIGVAITGTENLGFALIVTEGFGRIAMARRTFDLLSEHAGRKASVCGATQIRAGVIRPEIIVAADSQTEAHPALRTEGLGEGDQVRVIREPWFGRIGTVLDLPAEPRALATESLARVVRLVLASGEEVTVPRTNVEIIEE